MREHRVGEVVFLARIVGCIRCCTTGGMRQHRRCVAGILRMVQITKKLILRQTVCHGLANHRRDLPLLMPFELEMRKVSPRLERFRN
jgi:hypothetical protein